MKKLTTAICVGLLGALAFAPAAQAGAFPPPLPPPTDYPCNESGDTHLKDYFCDAGILYEVTVNCMNLEGGIFGGLGVDEFGLGGGSGYWNFFVVQGTADVEDYVCDANGVYGDSLKTELKCTDAPTGANKGKPGKGNEGSEGYDQADFTIKSLGEDESCLL